MIFSCFFVDISTFSLYLVTHIFIWLLVMKNARISYPYVWGRYHIRSIGCFLFLIFDAYIIKIVESNKGIYDF